jgi:hypothetical protein
MDAGIASRAALSVEVDGSVVIGAGPVVGAAAHPGGSSIRPVIKASPALLIVSAKERCPLAESGGSSVPARMRKKAYPFKRSEP